MSPTQLEELVQLIGGDIYKMTFLREAIPVRQRLVLTLRFLASGDSMSSLSTHYLIGCPTVCHIIHDVDCAIWKNLKNIVFKKWTISDWKKISKTFHHKTHCIHFLGAIDGKHVNIQCPPNAGSTYYNFKGFHSIILLAVCNADYEFTYIDVGSYGRRSDGGVFSDSLFAQCLADGSLNIPPPELVVEGGPRWRIFRKPILMDPLNVVKMIKATVCLHNWLRMSDEDYVPPGLVDREGENGEMIPGTWRQENRNQVTAFENMLETQQNPSRLALHTREMFCDLYNNEYALPWQYDHI
ncbi:hypothetical protein QAD02_011234 [Eretmocerus hayati]|uniref:Uncharacterized protein n=1 Tax=Eretmocerus hayati TaxID=131215 RepID=A0ACC2NX64_9HYME|nr:hypothetical protein QAD02_011234 [Eretmocerus hayati]